ncbi:MAG: TetR/AcrR family transcriptional regulator [Actinomycetota bacterium]|nr:TetR/AcrR family transcriptional regulator [Actinomycetota bacterium]
MDEGAKEETRKKAANELAIKEAALKLFSEKGFYATSTRDITREACVSKGTLYWYWKSKDELAFSLVSDMLADFLALIERARDGEGAVAERLDKLINEVAELYYQETDYLRLLWKFRVDRKYIFTEEYTEKVTSYYICMRNAFETMIRQGMDNGEFRKVDPKQMAFIILGITEGMELEWLENEEALSMRDALVEIMDILLSSLRK